MVGDVQAVVSTEVNITYIVILTFWARR